MLFSELLNISKIKFFKQQKLEKENIESSGIFYLWK
jgi:hypothetical protein